jgi:hypothetical protein
VNTEAVVLFGASALVFMTTGLALNRRMRKSRRPRYNAAKVRTTRRTIQAKQRITVAFWQAQQAMRQEADRQAGYHPSGNRW